MWERKNDQKRINRKTVRGQIKMTLTWKKTFEKEGELERERGGEQVRYLPNRKIMDI